MTAPHDDAPTRAEAVVLGGLTLLLVATAYVSLTWRPNGDAAIMLYTAWLQRETSVVIYRDLFDMNAPGAHAVSWLVMALTGGGDRALRMADLAITMALLGGTAAAMRPFGRTVAWTACLLTGLLYLGAGDSLSLQRELFVLLPTCVVLTIAMRARLRTDGLTMPATAAAGVCAGLASTVKPQAGLLVLVIVAAGWSRAQTSGARARWGAAVAAGFVAPWLLVVAWLWTHGALTPFLDIATRYWPLYDTLTGRPYGTVSGWARVQYLAEGYARGLVGTRTPWVLAAIGGFAWFRWASARTRTAPQIAAPLVALAAITLAFPGLAGKFWDYHWLPFSYAMVLLAALGLIRRPGPTARRQPAVLALLVVLAAVLAARAWIGPSPRRTAELARVDSLQTFLDRHLRAGDLVQPLDWTGTALHAMLGARVRLATPFLEDVHFYHHAADPYIQAQRARLVQSLDATRPRFILQVDQDGWRPGPDTAHPFPALGRVLATEYYAVATGPAWEILERRTGR